MCICSRRRLLSFVKLLSFGQKENADIVRLNMYIQVVVEIARIVLVVIICTEYAIMYVTCYND